MTSSAQLSHFLGLLIALVFNLSLIAQTSLVSPKNGTITSASPVEFIWNELSGANSYRLVVSESNDFTSAIIDETGNFTSFTTGLPLGEGDYYWRVETDENSLTFISPTFTFSIVDPSSFVDLVLWVNGNSAITDVDNKVSEWTDLSGEGHVLLQSSTSLKPLRVEDGLNDLPILRFDGGDRMTSDQNTVFTQPNTLFIIWKMTNASTAFAFDGKTEAGSNSIFWSSDEVRLWAGPRIQYTKTAPFDYILNSGILNASNSSLYENGVLQTVGNPGTNPIEGFQVGARYDNGFPLTGDIAEIMFFNRALDEEERELLEDFLRQKYFPLVDLGQNIEATVNDCPVILDAGERFESYLWSTGETTETIEVTEVGTYSVEVTDLFGYTSNDTIEVNFSQFDIIADDPSTCLTDEVLLTADLPAETSFDVEWNTTETTPAISTMEGGFYSFQATSAEGCTFLSDTLFFDSFILDFTLGPDGDACNGSPIVAIPEDESDGFSFLWSDATVENQVIVNGSGTYSVEVTNPNGCTANDEIEINVIGTAPSVSISDLDQVCKDVEVLFQSTSTGEGADEISTWDWDFGDGSNGSGETVNHQFDEPGNYTVTLNVESNAGCSNFDFFEIEVEPSPEPEFEVFPGCVNAPLEFNDLSAPSEGMTISSWSWDFGNGDQSNDQNPIYTYETDGNYSVVLTVAGSNGCARSSSQIVEVVSSAPAPEFFNITYPGSGQTLESGSIPFVFNLSENADLYTLEIAADEGFQEIVISETTLEMDTIVVELDPGTYYARMIASNFCNDERTTETVLFNALNLGSLAPRIVHYEGSDVEFDNEAVMQINDQSENDYHAVQLNSPFQPDQAYLPELDNKAAIQFDGNDDRLLVDFGTSYEQPITAFALWKINSNTSNHFLYDGLTSEDRISLYYAFNAERLSILSNPDNIMGYNTSIPFENPLLNTAVYNGAESKLRENGVLRSEGDVGDSGISGLTLGNIQNGSAFLNGYFAEIMIYEGLLSDEATNAVESFLMDKYAPPVNLGVDIRIPYGFCDTILDAGARFVAYEWSTGETSQTLEVSETGVYGVTVTDIFGRTSTDSIRVIYPGNFIQEDFEFCEGDLFTYDTEIPAEDYTIEWNTSETTTSISFSEGGAFQVTVSDTLGCSYTSPLIIATVDSFPLTADIIDYPTFCLGNPLFLASGSEEAETYLWSTDHTTPSIEPDVSGEYWVEAVNGNACVGRDTVEVDIVGEAPSVEYSTGVLCAENPVSFSDLTVPVDAEISEQLWNIQSENESESETFVGQEIIYNAEETGDLYVNLTVTLENGCTGSIQDTIFINPLPIMACANCNEVIACKDLETVFNSGVPEQNIDSYFWQFSNGDTEEGAQAAVVFDELGTYTVKHYATTNAGCTDSTEAISFEVLGVPDVNFSYDTACAGQLTGFFENVNTSESGPVWYEWNFGAGNTSNFPNAFWDFAQGVHFVTLVATGNNNGQPGCSSGLTQPVYVFGEPDGEITTGQGCEGSIITLTDLTLPSSVEDVTDPISQRAWYSLEDPENPVLLGTDSLTQASFSGTGQIPILFEYTTVAGCSGAVEGTVFLEANPESVFELDPDGDAAPQVIIPENNATNAVTYTWNVNGEFVSDEEEPELEFPDAGTYTIELIVSNSLGCSDTSSTALSFISPEYDLILVEVNPVIQNGNLQLNLVLGNSGNAPIEEFDLEITMGSAFKIKDTYEGFIGPGDVELYSVPTEIEYDPSVTKPYVCVRADNPNGVGELELDLTNNYLCEGLVEEGASFIPPYPNPTIDVLNLGIVLPRDGRVDISVSESSGKTIVEFGLDLEEGYSIHEMDVRSWAEGLYFVNYKFRDQEKVEKVVISR